VGEGVGLRVGVTVGVLVPDCVGDAVGDTVGVGFGPTWFDVTIMAMMMPAIATMATIATIIHAVRADFLRPIGRGVYDTIFLHRFAAHQQIDGVCR
jgi:hypothetical protein